MKIKFFVILGFAASCFMADAFAQNKKAELVSPQGIRYIHHVQTNGKKADHNGVVKLHFKVYGVTKADKDTLLMDTWSQSPSPIPAEVARTPFKDVMNLVSAGDSVSTFVKVDSLPAQGLEFAKAGSDLRYDIKIVEFVARDVFEAAMKAEQAKQAIEMMAQKAQMREMARKSPLGVAQDSTIKKYIADNKLNAVQHESGMYIVYEKKGEGTKLTLGENVAVHYTGLLLDGTKFDSSLDRNEPISIPIGTGQVIDGWDVGIMEFNKGGKGKLIIPSYMAYGDRGAGGVIPPNAPLVFDIEVMQ